MKWKKSDSAHPHYGSAIAVAFVVAAALQVGAAAVQSPTQANILGFVPTSFDDIYRWWISEQGSSTGDQQRGGQQDTVGAVSCPPDALNNDRCLTDYADGSWQPPPCPPGVATVFTGDTCRSDAGIDGRCYRCAQTDCPATETCWLSPALSPPIPCPSNVTVTQNVCIDDIGTIGACYICPNTPDQAGGEGEANQGRDADLVEQEHQARLALDQARQELTQAQMEYEEAQAALNLARQRREEAQAALNDALDAATSVHQAENGDASTIDADAGFGGESYSSNLGDALGDSTGLVACGSIQNDRQCAMGTCRSGCHCDFNPYSGSACACLDDITRAVCR